jgi:hypothetical protein
MQDSATNLYELIFKRSFPGIEPNCLLMMSDSELRLVMLEHMREEQPSVLPPIPPPPPGSTKLSPETIDNEEFANSPNMLEEQAVHYGNSDQVLLDGFSGNFNSFARHPSCYLGVASALAALKVIDWIQPGFLHYICNNITQPAFPLHCSPEIGGVENSQCLLILSSLHFYARRY